MNKKDKKGLLATMLMLGVVNNTFTFDDPYYQKDSLDGIDIEKEYNLIQEKKSRLSANIRKMVVDEYERWVSESEKGVK